MNTFLLLKSLFFLTAILLLIYACFLVAKKRFLLKEQPRSSLKIIAHQKIDPKLSVSVIEIDEQRLVIAANQSTLSIRKIHAPLSSTHPSLHHQDRHIH